MPSFVNLYRLLLEPLYLKMSPAVISFSQFLVAEQCDMFVNLAIELIMLSSEYRRYSKI